MATTPIMQIAVSDADATPLAILTRAAAEIDRYHELRARLMGESRYPRVLLEKVPTSVPGQIAIRVHLTLPDTDDAQHFAPLQILLEALTQINEHQIRAARAAGVRLPPLYESGVRYREEAPGQEDWPDIPTILANGWGDCEDLVGYRAAELRDAGIDADPVLKWQFIPRELMIAKGYPKKHVPKRGVWLVHCLVRYPDGTIEDPSKLLGMGGSFLQRI